MRTKFPHLDEQTRKEKAAELFEKMEKWFPYLYSRWQDEKQYEDFNDYISTARNNLLKDCPIAVFVNLKKRPFALTLSLGGATYEFFCSSTKYGYKRIA